MPLQHLQHFLIQTGDLEKTKDWYVDVLGMRVGPHPDFKFPVYWLYLGEDDVLHITQGGSQVSQNRMKYLGQQSTATTGSGVVDHVAFRATGLLDLIDHLNRKASISRNAASTTRASTSCSCSTLTASRSSSIS